MGTSFPQAVDRHRGSKHMGMGIQHAPNTQRSHGMACNIYAIRVNIAAALHQPLNGFRQGSLNCLVGPAFCRLFIGGGFVVGVEPGWQWGSKHISSPFVAMH